MQKVQKGIYFDLKIGKTSQNTVNIHVLMIYFEDNFYRKKK